MLLLQVDFLPSIALTAEQLEAAKANQAALAKATRTAVAIVDGQSKQYTVQYARKFKTNGGYLMDVKVTCDHQETNHR